MEHPPLLLPQLTTPRSIITLLHNFLKLHVNMATVSVALAESLAHAHASRGIDYVAAPVMGRPDVAAAARLTIMAGGPAEAIGRGPEGNRPIAIRQTADPAEGNGRKGRGKRPRQSADY